MGLRDFFFGGGDDDGDDFDDLVEFIGGMKHEDGDDWGTPADVLDDPLWEESGKNQGLYYAMKYGDDYDDDDLDDSDREYDGGESFREMLEHFGEFD